MLTAAVLTAAKVLTAAVLTAATVLTAAVLTAAVLTQQQCSHSSSAHSSSTHSSSAHSSLRLHAHSPFLSMLALTLCLSARLALFLTLSDLWPFSTYPHIRTSTPVMLSIAAASLRAAGIAAHAPASAHQSAPLLSTLSQDRLTAPPHDTPHDTLSQHPRRATVTGARHSVAACVRAVNLCTMNCKKSLRVI